MQLTDLGYDDWFVQQQQAVAIANSHAARVTAVDRDRYLIRSELGEISAECTGKLLYMAESPLDLPAVGDWVVVQSYDADTFAVIHAVLPRKSLLARKTAGKKVEQQLIATNIDVAFIMQSCDRDFNLRRLERYLVMAREGHVEPKLILSKSDLLDPEELNQKLQILQRIHSGVEILVVSNHSGYGLDRFIETLKPGKSYCLLGSSGVGKTTLLNHLLGEERFATAAVREKDGRGRHTTARRQLILLANGAMIIDTPGMRELGLMATKDSIEQSFADIHELTATCRFKDCTHQSESGCALRAAVATGQLSEERYQSYLKLLKESTYHQMSYVEKRRSDKKRGRYYRSVLKSKGMLHR